MADMKLVDGGAHSVGVNNDNDRQYVSATPKGTLTSVVEFTNVGGVLGQPTVQNAASGLISTGTELWFKNSGSNTLVKAEVGGVSTSGSGPYTYTFSSLSPALTGAIGDWTAAYKIRSDKTKPLMYLATGQTDEPLVKETALTLAGSGTTASQVVTEQASSILPYFASGNLSRDLIVTVGGVDSVVQPNGTVTESSAESLIVYNSGTTIGGATGGGGIAAAFDNNNSQAHTACAYNASNTEGTAWVGKNWGAGVTKDILKVVIYSSTNLGWCGDTAGTTITFKLYGSNNGTDYTLLATWTETNASAAIHTSTKDSGITAGSYQYHKVTGVVSGSDRVYFGEVQFYGTTYTYTTTIPIATQASAPTAAKLANRFTTAVDIDTVTYVTGPELDVAGETTTLTDDPTLKRLALKVRGDTALGVRSKDWMIETTEKVA